MVKEGQFDHRNDSIVMVVIPVSPTYRGSECNMGYLKILQNVAVTLTTEDLNLLPRQM